MLIAVVGGKLQGVEITYLAKKTGWTVVLIDKNPKAPATKMCDTFIQFDFSSVSSSPGTLPKVDLIIPAVEDIDVLTAIKSWADTTGTPLAFDIDAYDLTSSKLKSDTLFKKMALPAPRPWPDCGFPLLVKPDQGSGSKEVRIYQNESELSLDFPDRHKMDGLVTQEYVGGPSYSVEVLGVPGRYQAVQVTEIWVDAGYDCKRVLAPAQLGEQQVRQLNEMGVAIAEEIELRGIMDVEVILNKGELKLLEIDARFPSQTPTAVYWSRGINMVEMLGDLCLHGGVLPPPKGPDRHVIFEHIKVSDSSLEVCGEHIMATEGPLTLHKNFFGANEAITNYEPGCREWVATLIVVGISQREAFEKKMNCVEQIQKECQLGDYLETAPENHF